MIILRNFTNDDAEEYQQKKRMKESLDDIKEIFAKWETKAYEGKYFEVFAILNDGKIVGTVTLYQHSENVISCGPEIFEEHRRNGIGTEAMRLAMDIAKGRGYKVALQQIRVDNAASIAMHNKLGFETDEYIYKNKKGNDVLIFIKLL